jgi:hypothetical protein
MRASQFHQVFGGQGNFWGSDSVFPIEGWQEEGSNDETRLGYWDWVLCQREQAADEVG